MGIFWFMPHLILNRILKIYSSMFLLINATQSNYLVSERCFYIAFGLIIFETKILRSKSIFFSGFPDPCSEHFFPQLVFWCSNHLPSTLIYSSIWGEILWSFWKSPKDLWWPMIETRSFVPKWILRPRFPSPIKTAMKDCSWLRR